LNQGAWQNHPLTSRSRFPTRKVSLEGLIDAQMIELPWTSGLENLSVKKRWEQGFRIPKAELRFFLVKHASMMKPELEK